jgi:hypothetical protein
MAFSTRFRFRTLPRIVAGALGDMWYRATNGDMTAVRGTKAAGKAPVIQADGGLTWTEAGGFVPTYIGPAETFTIPDNRQATYAVTIDNEGTIELGENAYLSFVD